MSTLSERLEIQAATFDRKGQTARADDIREAIRAVRAWEAVVDGRYMVFPRGKRWHAAPGIGDDQKQVIAGDPITAVLAAEESRNAR